MDITGKKFNKLLVLNPTSERKKSREIIWSCKCDCGNVVSLSTGALTRKSGATKSCGCIKPGFSKREPSLNWRSGANTVYESYKNGAKERNLDFMLTFDEAIKFFNSNCYYCDTSPSNIKKDKSKNTIFTYNGIDRVDNKLGYSIDNCVACCRQCNTAKNFLTLEDFKTWIKKIYNKFNSEIL